MPLLRKASGPLYAISIMPLFGNERIFGIRCSTNGQKPSEEWVFIHCHLVLGGQLIGNPEETDALGVSAGHLKQLRDKVLGSKENLSHPLFESLTDVEILELILKSNQLEEEYDPRFAHLPALEHEGLWGKHHFSVGESTDDYFLAVINQSGKIKFLWRNLRTEEKQTHTATCNREEVVDTINACLSYLKDAFPERLLWLHL